MPQAGQQASTDGLICFGIQVRRFSNVLCCSCGYSSVVVGGGASSSDRGGGGGGGAEVDSDGKAMVLFQRYFSGNASS